jgi:hypothetical protein
MRVAPLIGATGWETFGLRMVMAAMIAPGLRRQANAGNGPHRPPMVANTAELTRTI